MQPISLLALKGDAIAGKRILTSIEFRKRLGKPHAPCAKCGCPILAVSHFGDEHCIVCEPEHSDRERDIVFRLVVGSDGIAEEYERHLKRVAVESRYPIDLSGVGLGRWRVEKLPGGGERYVREGFENVLIEGGGWPLCPN